VEDASFEVVRILAGVFQGVVEREEQVVAVPGSAVGEDFLGELPDQLIGVQLGGIARQRHQVKPPGSAQQLLDEPGTVGSAAVPDQKDVASQVPEQMAQELDDLLLVRIPVKVSADSGRR